jgi:glycosyltransferase involved in cell wall biosynthesis
MPLVSHILPVWNAQPDWFLAAVRSVLAEDGCELELVVVDDGSDVPAERLLADVDDERLRVVRTDQAGVSRARNAGLDEARGDYVRFVDADDIVARGSTSRLLALAGGSHVVAYGSTAYCDETLRPIWTMRCSVEGNAVQACLLGRFTVRIFSMLFPRSVVDAAGRWDPDFRVSEDWDFVLRTLEAAPVRASAPTATYYRKNRGSATGDLAAGAVGGKLVLDRYFARHPELVGSRLERRARAGVDATRARTLLSRRRLRGGMQAALRATVVSPSAIVDEARRSAPAVAGHVRVRVGRSAPSPVAR